MIVCWPAIAEAVAMVNQYKQKRNKEERKEKEEKQRKKCQWDQTVPTSCRGLWRKLKVADKIPTINHVFSEFRVK